jgi:hypothetical protein
VEWPWVAGESAPERIGKMELEKGKIADRKGTVKAVWQKTGMALKKKKKKVISSAYSYFTLSLNMKA